MRLMQIGLTVALVTAATAADTVTLRNGQVVTGTFLGASSREMRIDVGDQVRTLDLSQVAGIQFGANGSGEERQSAAPPAGLALPAGTNLVIRMIDAVDSERNAIGQTFAASLDEPVMIDGETVIPRGADVVVKLVDDKESGKLTGRTTLTLDLMSVKVAGRMVDVNTETVTEKSSSRGARTAKLAGGGALLGTIIGAVAGGGKGAGVGLASGAAAGAGAEILTKGQRVHIPSETRLTFVLENAVRLR